MNIVENVLQYFQKNPKAWENFIYGMGDGFIFSDVHENSILRQEKEIPFLNMCLCLIVGLCLNMCLCLIVGLCLSICLCLIVGLCLNTVCGTTYAYV
jgi:hypothetical protein